MKKQFNLQIDTKGVFLDVYGYQEGDSWEVTGIKPMSFDIALNKQRMAGSVYIPLEKSITKELTKIIMATGELNVIVSDAVNKHLGIEDSIIGTDDSVFTQKYFPDIFGQLSDLNPNFRL